MGVEEVDITKLTEKYNKERLNLPFVTIPASERDIRSLLRLYPKLLDYKEEDLIREIGWQIHLLSFNEK